MRGPNCARHVWFGYEGGFALGHQKRTETGSCLASVGDKTETEMAAQESVETLVHGSSCWPGKHV